MDKKTNNKNNSVVTMQQQKALISSLDTILTDYKLTKKEYKRILAWQDEVLNRVLGK